MRLGAVAIGLVLVLVAGSASARRPRASLDVVLYSIGISTNPYGHSNPRGFGVASLDSKLRRVEVRGNYGGYPGAEWLDRGRILAPLHAPPLRSPSLFAYRNGKLLRLGTAPFPGGSSYWWSPDWTRVAYEPPVPCRAGQRSLFSCYRTSGHIFVSGSGRVASGSLGGWTRSGRLVFYPTKRAWSRGDATILDLRSGARETRRHYWPTEQPIRSADARYLATRRGVKHRTQIVISGTGGGVVQTLETHYILSMFAWSTRGHLLAYTTSGFPSPHQLFVVDPGHEPRKIFATGRRHFDWITWSPDGRKLLLDGDAAGGWRVFSARTGRQLRLLPRLGGRPLWCCPVNEYRGNGR